MSAVQQQHQSCGVQKLAGAVTAAGCWCSLLAFSLKLLNCA